MQGSRELLEALREVSQPRPAGSDEAARPLDGRTGSKRQEPGAHAVPTGAEPRAIWRRGGWVALAGLVVGIGLVVATWWGFGSEETQREAGASGMNSLGMEFVWIPAGTLLMGSPEDEEGRFPDERQHEVRISEGFWIGKHEVTQGEWEAVMGTNPSHFSDCAPQCPVEEVSWDDTQEFIRKLNGWVSGRAYMYRLPTEAEWEYAARAGTTGIRHGKLDEIAWHRDNSGNGTQPVGQKRPNAWGLHDMLGNVWEWVGDWYGEYPSGPVTDPGGPESGSGRVLRGGGWNRLARYVRSASRSSSSPGYRSYGLGFRLVRTE